MPVSHKQVLGQKPTFRNNAEHYVVYNALHVIYHDTISCNIFKLRTLLVATYSN